MNAELEALLLAYDAVRQARGEEAERLEEVYRKRIEEVISRHPGISREMVLRAVDFAHRRWLLAQQKPPTLPPKA